MYIEELKEGDSVSGEQQVCGDHCEGALVVWDPKRVLVGAGARALFYPTLLYNVVRNKIQTEFRWWDRVDQYVLLGAVPFPTDVPRLKALGVGGVVTLNEPYETLVPTSLYHDHSIEHLVIPTRDYLFAPSHGDICQAVDFIHGNALCGKTTYVHCKAGRGRSTTIVLCYLVKHKQMTPEAAFEYVRSIRPRVLLASSQWQAVQDYYHGLEKPEAETCMDNLPQKTLTLPAQADPEDFDDNSLVLITESDLDGYEESPDSGSAGQNMLTELNLACRVQFASQAAFSRLSCLWLRSQTDQQVSRKKLQSSVRNSRLGNLEGSEMSLWLNNGAEPFVQLPKKRFPYSVTVTDIEMPDLALLFQLIHHMDRCALRRCGCWFLAHAIICRTMGISPALPSSGKTKKQNPYDEKRLLEQNKRIQRENNAPDEFPNFVREGFTVKVVTSDKYVTRDSGLILWDFEVGKGDCPKAGQQVTFHYVGYNESGRRIDSTYLQGSPAKVRLGTNALIPGFEEGIRDMKPGGKRRIIVPPELGPPVGPSTFFSSKQFEVFDIELLSIQDCTRRTIGFYSDVVCG
ncbi:putative dual specificity protein phosphatase DSP8 [Sesamum alatum]|uniref:peptidylprolyl isomerase n=1 Tax=Sesamum alatum TaxID=300844 RepID=A0AAE1XNA2_9LAMI|nr:putative dual specificity protein phosphatase DSP8 [Sesamum alatum]